MRKVSLFDAWASPPMDNLEATLIYTGLCLRGDITRFIVAATFNMIECKIIDAVLTSGQLPRSCLRGNEQI